MNAPEVFAWIESKQEEMTSLLVDLVNINSWSDNLEGLTLMASRLKYEFCSLKAKTEILTFPSVDKIDAKGKKYVFTTGPGLLLTQRPDAPFRVLLGGHMDTVYPASSGFLHAKIADDIMYGPGTTDMKGGLVIMLYTLKAWELYREKNKIGWQVLLTPDEEIGSVCSAAVHKKCAAEADIGMIFEPSFPDGSLADARKGLISFSLISKGKSAHSGRDFYEGVNAIVPLMRVLLKLETLNDKAKGITLNIAKIEGGGPANIVPDIATALCSARQDKREDLLYLKERIRYFIEEENKTKGSDLTFFCNSERVPKIFDENHQNLYKIFQSAAEESGIKFLHKPSGGVCDGNIWADVGLPNVDTLGCVGGNIHTPNEYIEIKSLVERAKMNLSFLIKIAAENIPSFNVHHKEAGI